MRRAAVGPAIAASLLLLPACGDGPPTASFQRVPSTVEVSPSADTVEVLGATRQFTATARDQNGVVIPGVKFVWTSSDTAVASVDATGLTRTRSEGLTTIVAAVSSVQGSASLLVGGAAPLEVTSVSPSPVVEGEPATLTGTGFSSSASENRVLFDSAEASVTSASTTELTVTVPDIGCEPLREVEVTVEVSGETSDPLVHAVEPAEPPLSLDVGQQKVVSGPEAGCLQFERSAADEAYLLGVQSASEAAGASTPVTVTGEVESDTGAASAISNVRRRSRSIPGRGVLPQTGSRWTRHRLAEANLRIRERRLIGGRRGAFLSPSPGGLPAPAAVGPDAEEGDSVAVRVPTATASEPCADFTEISAVVRHVGEHGIWVADTENPEGGYSDADLAELSDAFDGSVYPVDTAYFGTPGDRDKNGRVVHVITQEVNQTEGLLGFVFAGDLVARPFCPASDEGEITYLRAPDPDSTVGPVYTVEQARADVPDLTAHELTHVIQSSRRSEANRPLMDAWLAEAQAQLAEEVVGHASTGRSTGQNYGFHVAWNEDEETKWYRDGFVDLALYFGFRSPGARIEGAPEECSWLQEDPSPCLGRPLWYGVGWSFLRWLSDHLGPEHPGGERGLHRDLVGSALTGFANVESVVGTAVPALLPQWAAALYVDDRVAGAESRLTLPSWNLKQVSDSLVTTGRLLPDSVGFKDFSLSYDVTAASSAYLIVGGGSRPHTTVRVRSPDGSALPSTARVWIVRLR